MGENVRFSASDHIMHQGEGCKQRSPGSYSNAPRYPARKSFCSGSKCLFLFLIFSYASLLLIAFAGCFSSIHPYANWNSIPNITWPFIYSFIHSTTIDEASVCQHCFWHSENSRQCIPFPHKDESTFKDFSATWSYTDLTLHQLDFTPFLLPIYGLPPSSWPNTALFVALHKLLCITEVKGGGG